MTKMMNVLKIEFKHYWVMNVHKHECTDCNDIKKNEHAVYSFIIYNKNDFIIDYIIVSVELFMKMKKNNDEDKYKFIRILHMKFKE